LLKPICGLTNITEWKKA